MTSQAAAVWLVMGGAAVLHVLGASLALTLLRGRHVAFSLTSGLLWGVAMYGVLAAGIVLVRSALGALPLYPTAMVAATTTLVAAGSLALCLLRAPRFPASRVGLLAAHGASAAVVAAAALVAVSYDLSTLTPDSLDMIEAALGLARIRDPLLAGMPFLGSRGLLGVLLHAPAAGLPFDFFWFASPLLGAACMATLAVASWDVIRESGRTPAVAAVAVVLASVWLLGCYFWLYQLFYVHVNQLAGAMLLLFFVATWRSLVTRDDGWLALAGLALLAFQMLRVEGTFFAALVVAIGVLERAASDREPRGDRWLVLPGVLWCGALALTIGEGGVIVDRPRLLLMGALLLGCLPLGRVARVARSNAVRERLPGLALAGLAVAFGVLVTLRPEHMIQRLGTFAWNALALGLWSAAWAFVPAVVLAAPLLGRIPHQRMVQLALGAYFVGLLALTFVGYWREGWYDSGNRMLTHALPTLVWLGTIRVAAILPPAGERKDSRDLAGQPPGC